MSHALECRCGRAYLLTTEADSASVDVEPLTVDMPDGSIVPREDASELIHATIGATQAALRRRGAPPLLSDDVVAIAREVVTKGASIAQVAKALGCHYNTLYRRIGSGVAQVGRRNRIDTVPDDVVARMLDGSRNLSINAPIPPMVTRDYGEAAANRAVDEPAEVPISELRHARVLESWLARRVDDNGLRTTDANVYWLVAFECGASRATTAAVLREEVTEGMCSNEDPVDTARRLGITLGAVLRVRNPDIAPAPDADDVRNRTVDGLDRG